MTKTFDVIIIGSGAAGLTAALTLAPHRSVLVIAKGSLADGSTSRAQGGIAAVLDAGDSFEAHIKDTMIAGAGLNNRETVEFVVSNAPFAIERLADLGVPFNQGDALGERWHLTLEGGHSRRRVIHVDDATGAAVQDALSRAAESHPNITLATDRMAIDLICSRHAKHPSTANEVWGVYALNRQTGQINTLVAKATVLCTGGAGRTYLFSTAPEGATGDGIAMAWRAGCRVANMEMTQFHPTCLYHPHVKNFLISEALRGEGGVLKLPPGVPGAGERFMERFDVRGELAPRDVVARAIDHEIKRLGLDFVLLDISHKPAEFIREHFPTIYSGLFELGLDITKDPIPVVPAQHYTCGGVKVDLDGRTDLSRLYAAGEVAETGLHGANRLASNSLLECFVFGEAAARHILDNIDSRTAPPEIRPWDDSRVSHSDEEVVVQHNWREIRRFMWDYVGIVRTTKRLERAMRRVDLLTQEVSEYYSNFRITPHIIELRNILEVSRLTIRSALERKESRGLHYTLDYPEMSVQATDTVLKP